MLRGGGILFIENKHNQSFKVSKIQSFKVSQFQSCKFSKFQSFQVSKLKVSQVRFLEDVDWRLPIYWVFPMIGLVCQLAARRSQVALPRRLSTDRPCNGCQESTELEVKGEGMSRMCLGEGK